jgi:phage tail protein X
MADLQIQSYRTSDGDMLDRICLKYYGQQSDAVEFVLENNPGLATLGPVFNAGVIILLPPMPIKPTPTVRLWGAA